MAELTKRERVMRTLAFQETDRVPLYDIFQNDGLIEYLGGEPLTVADGDRVKGRAIHRSLDMTRMPQGPKAPGVVSDDDGLIIRQERWTRWIIERPWDDKRGLLDWIWREIERAEAQVYDAAFGQSFHENMAHYQRLFGDDTVQIVESGVGLTQMFWAIGWEQFSYLMVDEPDLIEGWLGARHRAELRRVAAIADPERIPVALTYDDLAYKTGPLVSPRWLRDHWFPRLRALVDAWHERGALCIFHSDGDLWLLMDDLVAAGIDGLNPLEVAASMTVRQVRERYPQLVLTGGVDVSQLLPLGTTEEVREASLENIAATGGRGYFLGSSTELHWEIPTENILAMFGAARDDYLSTDRVRQPRRLT